MLENAAHAIITGGSSGIGLSVACLLAREGVSVSILARDQARLVRARNQISSVAADQAGVEAIACDVRSMPACQAAVERAISVHGVPNWAISCAGIVKPGTFSSLALPPDTDTPQLEFETKLCPRPTKEIAGVAGVWDPDKVALAIVRGARKGRFIVAPGVQLRLLSSVHSVVAPAFRAYQRWVIGRCRSVT